MVNLAPPNAADTQLVYTGIGVHFLTYNFLAIFLRNPIHVKIGMILSLKMIENPPLSKISNILPTK